MPRKHQSDLFFGNGHGIIFWGYRYELQCHAQFNPKAGSRSTDPAPEAPVSGPGTVPLKGNCNGDRRRVYSRRFSPLSSHRLMNEKTQNRIYGIHPVLHALKNSDRQCYKIVLKQGGSQARFQDILTLAHARNVRVETLPAQIFNREFAPHTHQGIIGYFSAKKIAGCGGAGGSGTCRQTPGRRL